MKGLKTLQNVQNQHGFHNLKQYSDCIPKSQMYNKVIEGGQEMAVFPSDIKKEAIKWMMDDEHCSNDDPCEHCEGTINFIKHFFNITDEEIDDFCTKDDEVKG